MAERNARRTAGMLAKCLIGLLTVGLIGLLLLACWTPALLGAPPDGDRHSWRWHHRPAARR